MLHSALFSLGLIEGGISGFYRTLLDYLGPEGTLIVPTFTYSFRRNEVFDVVNSPSAKSIGIFSEFVRIQPDAVRCPDPLFSMAAVGANAKEMMLRQSDACFGIGSTYARLFDANVLFMALGITYSTGLSGFMHIEKLAGVPYRKDEKLFGISRDVNGVELQDSAIHFARREDIFGATITNREPMGALLEENGASTVISYGYGRHLCLQADPWLNIVLSELEKNPLCMLDSTQYPDERIPWG